MKSPKHQIPNASQVQRTKPDTGSRAREPIPACADPSQFVSHAGKPCDLVPAAVRPGHRSHRAWSCGLLSLCLLTAVFCVRSSAQDAVQWVPNYTLPWWTIDGGGGTSTGSTYSITGTIGQPDAGPLMTGGNFTLLGGFWSILAAVQTPGAPYLTVFRTTTNTVVVSWPLAGAEGWRLEATNALPSLATPWPVIPPPYQTNGLNLQFIEPVPAGHKFYRLHKP